MQLESYGQSAFRLTDRATTVFAFTLGGRRIAHLGDLRQRAPRAGASRRPRHRGRVYIAYAVDGAKRTQDLINDLLAFSRAGRLAAEQDDVDLGALVEGVRRELAEAIAETRARIEIGALPAVRGDPSLLSVVFRNLIANAIKFHGDEPPHVVDLAQRAGESWEFTVADNGIGIEPEYAERIFVIFQRLHTRTVYPGTGIGLAITRKIVEHHGGRIWLEPHAAGAGATFRFTLPSDAQEAPTA